MREARRRVRAAGLALVSLVALLTGALPVLAEGNASVTGFADLYGVVGERNPDGRGPHIGQMEIDIDVTTQDRGGELVAALVYDAEAESFGLGQMTFEYPANTGWGAWTAAVGLFDVPFGIDWEVYPSIDRMLITQPMAVARSHDSWNDTGLLLDASVASISAALFATNGFESERTGSEGEVVRFEPSYALGGRVGVQLHSAVGVGVSYASFFDSADRRESDLGGLDLSVDAGSLCLKGEYIRKRTGIVLSPVERERGYYVQCLYRFGALYGVARYGEYDGALFQSERQWSAGCGFCLPRNTVLRAEYEEHSEGEGHFLVQVAQGFELL